MYSPQYFHVDILPSQLKWEGVRTARVREGGDGRVEVFQKELGARWVLKQVNTYFSLCSAGCSGERGSLYDIILYQYGVHREWIEVIDNMNNEGSLMSLHPIHVSSTIDSPLHMLWYIIRHPMMEYLSDELYYSILRFVELNFLLYVRVTLYSPISPLLFL